LRSISVSLIVPVLTNSTAGHGERSSANATEAHSA
jgi:hypothetical protein